MVFPNKEDGSFDEREEFFLKLRRLTTQPPLSEEFYERLRQRFKHISSGGDKPAELKTINLIRQSQQAKVEAVRPLVELYGQIVVEHCKIYLPEQEALRIAEQTFEEFVGGNYEGHSLEDKLVVLLLTIATRLSRAKAQTLQMEQFIDSNEQNPQAHLSLKEKDDLMLLRLRQQIRRLSWAEIATITGITAGAAKQRGYRMAKRLEESN